MSFTQLVVGLVLAAGACGAAAQQLYRWTDEKGRVHVTDTLPPPGAKDVRTVRSGSGSAAATDPAPSSAALTRAMNEFPVTLFTAPNCTEACAGARDLLNKRGVPFTETQVVDEDGAAELKRVSGADEVPVLKVGASVYKGFERSSYDKLLDSAGYPAAGVVPPRAQAAPQPPEGYAPAPAAPKAEPIKPEAPAGASGPYAPK